VTTLCAAAGPVRVEVGPALAAATEAALRSLVAAGVPAALMARQAGLWGPDAERVAAGRLGWLDAARPDHWLHRAVTSIRNRVGGFERLVLVGIGGSSLAAEVVADALGCPLTVLDTTDCSQVATVLDGDLARVLVVVSSKSGQTLETRSVYEVLWQAFRDRPAVAEPAAHFVAVTDPGSVLARSAAERGFPALLVDPSVGGRFSALTPFGLVPAGLSGADIRPLGRDAARLAGALGRPAGNPGLLLGAALGAAAGTGRDILYLQSAHGMPEQFGAWAEQLLAESTGKDGRGILPVVGGLPSGPSSDASIALVTGPISGRDAHPADADIRAGGPLGSQFLLWEYATAVAGRVLGINPFDEPDVAEAKTRTRALLAGGSRRPAGPAERRFTEGAVEVGIDPRWAAVLAGAGTLPAVLGRLTGLLGRQDYLAVTAYLDRYADAAAAQLRDLLARRTDRPVTFGWGPRYLHSTGQYHKGGPARGVFLQLTGKVPGDLIVPGADASLAEMQQAQARADSEILRDRGRPVLRLYLHDRRAGLGRLLAALARDERE
jgi:glucose-6-phosphate isomerase